MKMLDEWAEIVDNADLIGMMQEEMVKELQTINLVKLGELEKGRSNRDGKTPALTDKQLEPLRKLFWHSNSLRNVEKFVSLS